MKRGLLLLLAAEGAAFGLLALIGRDRARSAAFAGRDHVIGLPVDPYAPLEPQTTCDPAPKPGMIAFREAVRNRFGEAPGAIQNITRDCGVGGASEHKEGRAWDWFPRSKADGDALIRLITSPSVTGEPDELARRMGIMYIVWHGRIWRSYPRGSFPRATWDRYTGPNPHTDHVHFSLSRDGAAGETSFYVFPVL